MCGGTIRLRNMLGRGQWSLCEGLSFKIRSVVHVEKRVVISLWQPSSLHKSRFGWVPGRLIRKTQEQFKISNAAEPG